MFQYRKRYEVTCDHFANKDGAAAEKFQYRKRYEVTCDYADWFLTNNPQYGFNTASGMRSHATFSNRNFRD